MFLFTHTSGFKRGLLTLFLVAGTLARAEEKFFVRSWQSDEGLPDNIVVGIEQTPDGFLWVATQTGLLRFDGLQFRTFPTKVPGFTKNLIQVVCVFIFFFAFVLCGLLIYKDYGVSLDEQTDYISGNHGP